MGDARADLEEHAHVEGGIVAQPRQADGRQPGGVVEEEGEDTHQHEHRADQGVEEELDGRIQLARPPQTPIKKYMGTSMTSQKT